MKNQNFENALGTVQKNIMFEEFQNIESVIQEIFQILDEYDRINANLQRLGGEKLR